MSDIIKVVASVETIRYFKDEWGIIICSVDSVKTGDLKRGNEIILKGEMTRPNIGEIYQITAEFAPDPKWGDQYKIISFSSAIDFNENDEGGKKKFLTSIFTVNQVNAMYDALDDPFNALKEKDVKSLIKVKGIQMKTATSMIVRFADNLSRAKIFLELDDYNLTNSMVDKLLSRYKSSDLVIGKVKNNPYILCTEVKGIGWKKADQIAMSGGIGINDKRRVTAYILYYLDKTGEDGYSWITADELMGAILTDLSEDVEDQVLTDCIHELADRLWWSEDKQRIGLKKYFNLEMKIAEELIRIRDSEKKITCSDWEKKLNELEKIQGWKYNEQQNEAIKMVLNENVSLIYGLAGTGKTSCVSGILHVLNNVQFVQTSLSGRAASRMMEVTGQEGYTIHRLLEYPLGDKEYQNFNRNQDNQLTYDIYIIDEISMIGASLFYYLLRAIPSGSKVIMMGDAGQLESIGSGNVAFDMIHSDEIKSYCLTQIHRQAQKSGIISEGIKVRNGEQIIPKDWVGSEIRGELQDFYLNCYSDGSNTYYEVVKQFTRLMHEDNFSIKDCQIIVPIKKNGNANTFNLNNAIQELYNPKKRQKEVKINSAGKVYYLREGDKIINSVNNYKVDPMIYNGNLGIIQKITEEYNDDYELEECMYIYFWGIGEVKLPSKYWKNIELGYAITCHKYQGSQSKDIIFGMDFSAYTLLSRELVYTAITRATERLFMFAQTGALRMATSREGVSQKQTHLQQCLYDAAHPKIDF